MYPVLAEWKVFPYMLRGIFSIWKLLYGNYVHGSSNDALCAVLNDPYRQLTSALLVHRLSGGVSFATAYRPTKPLFTVSVVLSVSAYGTVLT